MKNRNHSQRSMMTHSFYALILCTLSSTATAAQPSSSSFASSQEAEPNDTLQTATAVDPIGSGGVTVVVGTVGDGALPERDVDMFTFTLGDLAEPPLLLTVELASIDVGLDAFVRVFDAQGNELINADDADRDDLDPRLVTYLMYPGTYFVGVSTATNPHYDPSTGAGRDGEGGTYALAIVTQSTNIPESPLEPNDRVTFPVFMGSESFSLTGEFIGDGEHGAKDVDIYELELTGPARIDVAVSAAFGSPMDPFVRVRNCVDPIEQFTLVDPCLMGASETRTARAPDAQVSVGSAAPQSIFVLVSSGGNRRFDPTVAGSGEIGGVGEYDLDVTVTYFDPTGIDEPNDSISTATNLPPFGIRDRTEIVVDGFLGDGRFAGLQGDRDVFRILNPEDARILSVHVEAESLGSTLDPVVVVYDADGRRVAYNDNSGGSRDARLMLPLACQPVLETTGIAYVLVMGTQQRLPTDPFSPDELDTVVPPRALTDGPGSVGPYRLTLQVETAPPSCANEPDDTLATATDTGLVDEGMFVCTGGVLGDSQCDDPFLDVDVYSFRVVNAPAVVEVEASFCFEHYDPIRFDAGIYDSQAQLLDWRMFWDVGEFGLLQVTVLEPGTYYVAVTGVSWLPDVDLMTPCAETTPGDLWLDVDIVIRLFPRREVGAAGSVATSSKRKVEVTDLYASRLDDVGGLIDVIDPATGAVTSTVPAPEARFGGSEGLAHDGSTLYFMGVGRHPLLYRMDPTDGTVLDSFLLWMGSGFFSDVAMLGGELFIMDYRTRSLHVIDPVARMLKRTLAVGRDHQITIGGGLAALAGPPRLYAADAFNTRNIYELYPATGAVTNVLSTEGTRPIALGGRGDSLLYASDWDFDEIDVVQRDGTVASTLPAASILGSLAGSAALPLPVDLDVDGDIDLRDDALFQRCFTGAVGSMAGACDPADVDANGHVDLVDFAPFSGASTGP